MCKTKYESPAFQKCQEWAIPADAGDGEPLPENLVLMLHKTCFETLSAVQLYTQMAGAVFSL